MKRVVLLAFAACGDNHAPTVDATSQREVVALPAQVNRELDVLFVLDNEDSTNDHQINLEIALPAMFAALALDGPADLHVVHRRDAVADGTYTLLRCG